MISSWSSKITYYPLAGCANQLTSHPHATEVRARAGAALLRNNTLWRGTVASLLHTAAHYRVIPQKG